MKGVKEPIKFKLEQKATCPNCKKFRHIWTLVTSKEFCMYCRNENKANKNRKTKKAIACRIEAQRKRRGENKL